tara:strand:- start:185 stop:487 length:303 start_codon:yes stop_codon:yes gene_type:complete
MIRTHHFFVNFVKLYKTGSIMDVKAVINQIKNLSIFRQILATKNTNRLIFRAIFCQPRPGRDIDAEAGRQLGSVNAKSRTHVRLFELVAGAGFEPTTFGL